jgi:peroxiredoxin
VVIVNEPPPPKKPKAAAPAQLPEPKAKVGEPVPAYSLPRLRSEEYVDLYRMRGRIIVLFFFASYSKASERWLPAYRDLALSLAARNVELIAVAEDADESTDRVQSYIDKLAPDVTVALDLNHKLGESFGIEELPAVAIIDGESNVRLIQKTVHGDADVRATEAKLHALIK